MLLTSALPCIGRVYTRLFPLIIYETLSVIFVISVALFILSGLYIRVRSRTSTDGI